jgi:hypothetical protein
LLSQSDIKRLFEASGAESALVLAKRAGLPYILVYNLIHQRVRSVNRRHYQLLFGDPPPPQAPLKVDGAAFRAMADLWLFLNDGLTRADLYRDLLGPQARTCVDHRIFSGKIRKIDRRLEHAMRQKFSEAGVDSRLLDQWLEEFALLPRNDRVPYAQVRPTLLYLRDELGIHPTSVLQQSVVRYESGMLKSVSRRVFDRAEALKQKARAMLRQNKSRTVDPIRESIVGRKSGYTLYTDIRQELAFVVEAGEKGAKFYLGRSRWMYERGKAKRIADWRARNILTACDRIIRQSPAVPLSALPPSRRQERVRRLIDVLKARAGQLLFNERNAKFEKHVLKPSREREAYVNPHHGLTPIEMAPGLLGMQRRAFGLMVANNCDIIRSVSTFNRCWYISNLYLKEISSKKDFELVLAKYKQLAGRLNHPLPEGPD